MLPFFEYTDVDEEFYREYIAPRIPAEIFDVHVHVFLKEHVEMITEEERKSHWASECAKTLSCDDAHRCARELYPDTAYRFAAFPTASPNADTAGMNGYVASMGREEKCVPLMMVRPEWELDYIEKTLVEGDYAGFKPYPGMVPGAGGEVGIFEFMPRGQWEILDRYGKAVMLHIGRKERFADGRNVRELLEARDTYPNVTIIIAHLGRSYCPYYLREGLRLMGNPEGFYFDTTAVVNPEVYDIAFSEIPPESILYGSDMHVLLWHGRREWTERGYRNLAREDFSWNTDRRAPEVEARYTLFLYEQMKAMLDAMDEHGFSGDRKRGVFGGNALRALGIGR